MRVEADWLRAPASQRAIGFLTDAGHQAFFVGGCVRNALLGEAATDIDIATDAVPDAVTRLAEAAGLRCVPTGIAHGTVTVVVEGRPFEITTFRRDIATDGRRATVAFSNRIEDDAARRDFTINALYADRDGTVLDPVGGLADLAERRVRFIGDPEERIREDYLRILRFFRFHARYADPGNGIDADGLAACAAHADGLQRLSRERVGAELLKLLAVPDPAPAVAAMAASGVLARILPGAAPQALAPLVHVEERLGLAPDPLVRLAALSGAEPPPDLRLSKAELRRLDRLAAAARGEAGPGELGYRLGAVDGRGALAIRSALGGRDIDPGAAETLDWAAGMVFPVKPADLMPDLEGPALGRRLKSLEDLWIASEFRLGRDHLLSRR